LFGAHGLPVLSRIPVAHYRVDTPVACNGCDMQQVWRATGVASPLPM
jgi:hypothetical protein